MNKTVDVIFKKLLTNAIIMALCILEAGAQTKYTKAGEGMTLAGIGYSKPEGIDVWSFQVGFTRDSRIGVGIHGSISGLPTSTKTLGVFGEGAIAKPDASFPIGFNVFLSVSKAWTRGTYNYQHVTYGGNSFFLGAEFTLASPGSGLIPFVQFSRTFSSFTAGDESAQSSANAVALGVDVVTIFDKRPVAIFTPGIIFVEGESVFALTVAFVINFKRTGA